MRPLAIELFCGSFGHTRGWLEAGGRAVGFDIEHLPHHGDVPSGASLVLQDVLTLHGSQFRDADVIFASPPCQNYSYLAMPWSRSKDPNNSKAAKALRKKWETEGPDNRLFDACFRIQREAIESVCHCDCWRCTGGGHCVRCDCQKNTGKPARYIPMIVENVRGAIPWVGPSKANFGSYHLWGDVAMVGNRIFAGRDLEAVQAGRGTFGMGLRVPGRGGKNNGGSWFNVAHNTLSGVGQNPVHELAGQKVPGFRFDGSGRSFQTASVKATGLKRPGEGQLLAGSPGNTSKGFNNWPKDETGAYIMPDGTKIGGDWFSDPKSTCRKHGSRSQARKAASAQIARIPFMLSSYLAKVLMPEVEYSYEAIGSSGRADVRAVANCFRG